MKIASAFLTALFASSLFASPAPVAPQDRPPASYEASESLLSTLLTIDVACILRTWKIVGVDVCFHDGIPRMCVVIENAYPCGILEAVRKPLATHLVEMTPFFKLFAPMTKFTGGTSSHTADSSSGTGLQFTEAHVYEFVPAIPLLSSVLPIVVPPGMPFSVSYLSELDSFPWRNGLVDLLADPEATAQKAVLPGCSVVPRTDDCAWSWGSYFPRIGFMIHPSEVMAAHLAVLRAGRVASSPGMRVGLSPYSYEPRTGHYIQMVRPARRACFSIGWPVTRMIEAGALSKEGGYMFVHFGLFRECKGCYGPRLAPARPPGP